MTTTNMLRVIIGAALIPSTAAHAEDKQPMVLAPTTPWNLEGLETGCTLRRAFGDAQRPLILEIVRFAPGDRFELKLSGDAVDSFGDRAVIQYGKLPPQVASNLMKGKTSFPDKKPVGTVFTSSSLAPKMDYSGAVLVSPQMEGQADNISIKSRGTQTVLQTGSLGKPFALMRKCTDALVSTWGLDSAVQSQLSRRVAAVNQRVWAKEIQKVYPMDQARRGQQARVNVRLIVGPDGSPADCKVVRSYNEPAFDKIACEKLLKYGQFTPALDASGSPVASYFVTTVIWTIG